MEDTLRRPPVAGCEARPTAGRSLWRSGRTALFTGLLAALAWSGRGAVLSVWPAAANACARTGTAVPTASGAEALLEVRSSSALGTSEGYLRFDVGEAVSSVDTARLRVYARLAEPGSAKLLVRSVSASAWDEKGLSWNNKPDQDVTVGSVEVVGISAAWYEVDVAQHLRSELAAGRRRCTFALVMGEASENRILIASREGAERRPELAVARPAFAAKISFLPGGGSPPAGYLPDHGKPYGPRPQGGYYGWSADNTDFMRDRAKPKGPNEKGLKGPSRLHETFAYFEHTRRPKAPQWEIAVPNGAYRVRLLSGDAQSYDSVFAVDAESALALEGIPDKNKRWVESVKDVVVKDGRLTLSSNPTGSKNKINAVEITEVAR